MKEKLLRVANVSLFAFAVMVLGTVQTSLWFQIFGYFPGPAFWIPCLVYVALFRSTLETVIFAYISGFILSTMTAMPEGILMIVCVTVAVSTQIFKQRIFWSASSYIMMTCGLAALLFHITHWCLSFLLGNQPMTGPEVSDWLIEALLTPLVAPVMFPVFRWFDQITQRDQSAEISAQVN